MKSTIAAILLVLAGSSAALAASVVNNDKEQRMLVVTEGARQTQLAVGAGKTVEFCAGGCFITMPNGDRAVLKGNETIEISGGVGHLK